MARLERARFLPHLSVLLLILAAYAVLSLPRTLRGRPDGPIPWAMPERLGPYQGEGLLFCQDKQCARVARTRQVGEQGEDGLPSCPSCGSMMADISIGERLSLPRDTPIFRKVYSAPDRPDIQATLVFSGTERMSIHRPQVCLVSQGSRLVNEYPMQVRAGPDRTIQTRVIEIVQEYTNAYNERVSEAAVFAYWYFSPERETSSHFTRLMWTAVDNALRNYRPRWGYVSITFPANLAQPERYQEILNDFVPRLYPLLEELRMDLRRIDGILGDPADEVGAGVPPPAAARTPVRGPWPVAWAEAVGG